MTVSRLVEYIFFFSLLLLAGYMVWLLVAPFVSALALAATIVTICYPLYTALLVRIGEDRPNITAGLTTAIVFVVIIIPIVLLSSLVVRELVLFYQGLDSGDIDIESSFAGVEALVQDFIPSFSFNAAEQLSVSAQWLTGNLGVIFAGTVSTLFAFFIALIATFYCFRDGQKLLHLVIKASPLPDNEDKLIFSRMARAVRAVVTGTLLIALIQGLLVMVGFWVVGIERSVLWGAVAAVGALVPGVGTAIVTFPAIGTLLFVGDYVNVIILTLWTLGVVGIIDNILAPYLIGRRNNLHPFVILIAVLGGLALFGPIGFIIGPVVVTLFLVLLEIYNQHIIGEKTIAIVE